MKQWKLIFTVLMSLLLVCTCMSALADGCEHNGDTWTKSLEDYPCEGYMVVDVFCGECNALLENNKIVTYTQQHAWVKTGDVVKATCEKGSYQLYTCAKCPKTMEESLSAPNGHKFELTRLVEPTCTTVGKAGNLCRACNTVEEGSVYDLKMKDHEWKLVGEPVAATCTEDGYKMWTCSVCDLGGKHYKEITETKKGHTLGVVAHMKEPTCTETGRDAWQCTTCKWIDMENSWVVEAKGHDMKLVRLEQPTCTKEGKEGKQCTVCKWVDEKTCYAVKKADHKWEKSGLYNEPTCTEGGFQWWKCSVCGLDYKAVDDNAKGHNFELTRLVEPTCTSVGKAGKLCRACNTVEEGSVYDLKMKDHDWKMVGKPVAATCTEDGYEIWTCSVCDLGGEHYKKITASKLGHKLTAAEGAVVVFVKEATCTQEGRAAWQCATCKWIDMENSWVVAKDPHDWKVSVITAPTCLKGGESCYECKVCGKTENNFKTDALGHDIETKAVTKEICANFNHAAEAYNICKRCNEITYRAPKTAYDSVEARKVNGCGVEGHSAYNYCSICKAVDPKTPITVYPALTHNFDDMSANNGYVIIEKYPADCLNDGFEVRQCKVRNVDGAFCDKTTKITLPKLGHDHGDLWYVVYEPTCTAPGKEENYCRHCGLDKQYREIAPLGHNYYTVKEVLANPDGTTEKYQLPTCEKDGWAYVQCKRSNCEMTGTYIDNLYVVLSAYGHKMSTWEIKPYACNEGTVGTRTCLNGCGKTETKVYVEAKGHQWVVIGGKEPTCTTSGKVDRVCSVCSAKEKNVWVAPTGHKEKVTTTEPTCTVAGKEVVTCETCGIEISSKDLAATGHVETKEVQTKAPTCTEKGAANVVCVKCDAVVGTKEIAALGHGTTKTTETKAPTCTADGAADVICTVCNKVVETKVLPKLGHGATKTVETKAPTCTAEGAADVICTVCNEVVETKAIAALGHGATEEVTTEPTCTEAGKIEEICSVCGDVLNTTEIAALGHKREEVTISVPSAEGPGLVRIQCEVCGIELGAYFVPYTDSKVNVLVNTDGVMVADLVDDVANIEETRVALIDLAVEGKTEYVLVAEDSFVIGYMTVEVAEGKLTITYKLVADAQLSDALLTIYANVEDLKAQAGTEYVAETVELDIASTFGTDTKVILAFTGAASFDAAACEAYVVDTEAVEAMKLLAD